MKTDKLFWTLVQVHCTRNLGLCLPYVREETDSKGNAYNAVYDPNTRQPFKEGVDENKIYPALSIFSNGDTIFDKMMNHKVINDKNLGKPAKTESIDDFLEFIEKEGQRDGVFINDSLDGFTRRAYKLNNSPEGLPEDYDVCKGLPKNFVRQNDSGVKREDIGTRTALANEISYAIEDVHGFQIKNTAYGTLGMGKVTHFRNGVLYEEFFIKQSKDAETYLRRNEQLVGVYRRYDNVSGAPQIAEEREIGMNELKKEVCYKRFDSKKSAA